VPFGPGDRPDLADPAFSTLGGLQALILAVLGGVLAAVADVAFTVAFAATGRSPFGTGSYETIFYRILAGQPDLDGVPARLMPLVTAALGALARAQWLRFTPHTDGSPPVPGSPASEVR